MGYIICLFIGYGVQAAKSVTGYRESNSWIGRNLGSLVQNRNIQLNQKYRLGVPVSQRHIITRKFLKTPPPPPPPPPAATLKEQTRCPLLERYIKKSYITKSSKLSDQKKTTLYIFTNVLDSKNLLKHFLLILLSNTQRSVTYLIYYRPDANFCYSTAQDKLLRH